MAARPPGVLGPGTGNMGSELPTAPPTPSPQGQNGDSHHCGDRLPLPVRSRKYQEGLDTAERRPREGGHSPLDSADVRVQVPRMVGSPSPPGHRLRPWLSPGTWRGPGPGDSPGHSVRGPGYQQRESCGVWGRPGTHPGHGVWEQAQPGPRGQGRGCFGVDPARKGLGRGTPNAKALGSRGGLRSRKDLTRAGQGC